MLQPEITIRHRPEEVFGMLQPKVTMFGFLCNIMNRSEIRARLHT